MSPEQIFTAISHTPDARDYQLDVRDVANLKREIEFEAFMMHKSDSESLRLKACSYACAAAWSTVKLLIMLPMKAACQRCVTWSLHQFSVSRPPRTASLLRPYAAIG